jgi:hypothetical protein
MSAEFTADPFKDDVQLAVYIPKFDVSLDYE